MSTERDEPVEVLHVDDDPAMLDLTADFLALEETPFEVHGVESAKEGLAFLDEACPDCVVSDYQMPGRNGLEFLELVREDHQDLPFILFTGQGSEEIAGEAIAAGVTDYLQKGGGTSQYTVLANRIANAASQYQLEHEFERRRLRFRKLIEHSAEVIPILDGNGVVEYVTPSVRRVLGYEPQDVVGDNAFEYIHPEDRERALARFMETVEDPDAFPDVEYRFRHADGSYVHLYGRAINLLEDPHVQGIVSYNRDVSELRDG